MKLIIKSQFLILLLSLFLMACSDTNIPEEGRQYIRLANPISNDLLAPVTEVFSLTCSHCRKLETYLPELSQKTGIEIGKMHITFNHAADTMAQLYYAAEIQLGRTPDHSFMEELFAAARHTGKKREHAIETAFSSRNLTSPDAFTEQQNKQLIARVEQIRKLSKQSDIHAVPTFIINGRYQLLIKGHKDPQEIANTISYLVNK